MKIRNLLAKACMLLDKVDVEDYLVKGQCSDIVAAEEEVKYLLTAYESAMETAWQVDPLCAEYTAENVSEIAYSDMPDRVTDVVSVTDGQGKAVDFTLKTGKIKLSKAEQCVKVSYNYIPGERTLDDEVDYREHNELTPRALIYLTVAEYHALKGSWTLAGVWYERYENITNRFAKGKRGCVIKRRLWW